MVQAERRPQRGRGKLKQLAEQRGMEILDLVKEAISAEGSLCGAAERLNVSRATINYHLTKAGIAARVILVVEFVPIANKQAARVPTPHETDQAVTA